MKKIILFALIIYPIYGYNFLRLPEVQQFIDFMVKRYNFNREYLENVFKRAKFNQDALNRYSSNKIVGATDYSWHRYKSKILIKESIDLGVSFINKYKKWLYLASKKFNVEEEAIVSFIRVESKFGLYGREYNVLDVLTTLAFHKNRKKRFFKSELKNLFILARREKLNIFNLRGSFAGAMGCVQQVPSIQLRYGVDLDRDGHKNPDSMVDCIGSIANFLHKNGWKKNLRMIYNTKVIGDGYLRLKSYTRSKYSINTLHKYGIYPISFPFNRAYFLRLKDINSYNVYVGDYNYYVTTKYNYSKRYGAIIGLYKNALKRRLKKSYLLNQ